MVLEPTKIVEIRMEKQYVIAVKFCFGFYFLFHSLWALNYYNRFFEKMEIKRLF
jgi:hypothetical protein